MAIIGLTESQKNAFSIVRGVRALAFPKNREYQRAAEFEFDVSRETAKTYKDERDHNGLVIPDDVLEHPFVKRDLTAGADVGGGHTVDEVLMSLVDIFVENNWASQNVTVLSGLVGNVSIPGQDDRGTAGWIGETGTAAETTPSFREVTLKPKHARAWTRITRQIVVQSSTDIEMFVRTDLARAQAKLVDTALMYGTGANEQPTGISLRSGIQKYTVDDALDGEAQEQLIDIVLNAEEHVADVELPEMDCEWLLSNKMRRRMKQVAFFGDYTEEPLLTRDGMLLGLYPTSVSSQVNSTDAFFARWRDCVMGVWQGMRVMVNPYTDDTTGQIRITVEKMVDTNLLRESSFCWVTDA